MSSNLKVNTILPSTGTTVAVSGIASVTSSVSIASSCTATTFYGSGANLTGITGTTINNNANNRIITGSGTANTLEGESTFTYGGSVVTLANANPQIRLTDTDISKNFDMVISGGNGFFSANSSGMNMVFEVTGSERLRITSGGHISQGGGAEPSSTNGAIGLKHGIKSSANNVIIGETTQAGAGYGLHLESRQTGRSGGARIAQIGMKNDSSGNGQISFFTSPSGADVSERMVISSDGTTTFDPSAGGTLKIGGSSAHTSKIVVADNGGTGNGNCLVEGGDGSDFFTIQSNGNVNFASGNGITFADSSTSQVLDDYEEGSYTPTFVSSGASWSYNHQYGYYQKVGNTVHVSFYITLSSSGTVLTGTTTNSMHIAVPFAATSATRYEAACCFSMIYKFNLNAPSSQDIPLTGRLYSGDNKIDLLAQFDDAAGYAYPAVKANQAGCGLAGSITYRV